MAGEAPAGAMRAADPAPGVAVTIEALTRAVQGPRHAVELQSVRGIAAMIVLIAHAGGYFAVPAPLAAVRDTVFNAATAVICFFVLSGFVLTLSQVDRPLTLRATGVFYVRRVFRIYPALWFATLVAVAYQFAARHVAWPAPVTTEWIGMVKTAGMDRKLLVETFLGKATELTLPVWTLFVELVGSALMPLVILLVVRAPLSLLPLFLALVAAGASARLNVYNPPTLLTGFVYGAALVPLTGMLRRTLRTRARARALAVLALPPLWFGGTVLGLAPYNPFALSSVLVTGFGATLLIAAVYARPEAFALLARPSFAWLGDISYSLYLLHMPIVAFLALGVIALFGATLAAHVAAAAMVLVVATAVICAAASTLSYRYVELPGIRLGKRAAAALQRPDLR